MIAANANLTRPSPVTFTVLRRGHHVQFTYEQVFIAGYKLWIARRYQEAAGVFEHLHGIRDRGPRADILLAHCKAMLGDYAGSSSTLMNAMPSNEYGDAASGLHDIFVMWKCGFFHDVKQGLEQIVANHPELPTPCLILADFLIQVGNSQQPPVLLRQAIERDHSNGAVAKIARSKLRAALTKVSNTPPPPSVL